jgi:nicotinamide-nucleotide amidase
VAPPSDAHALAERLGRISTETHRTVAVAESLTGGSVAVALAAATDASEWFRGGLVAYMTEVKREVLAVRPGPVVSEAAAVDMARGIVDLLGADVGLAVTGVGGPAEQDGQPVGTVWVAVAVGDEVQASVRHFDGSPEQIVDAAGCALLEMASDLLTTEAAGRARA